MKNDRALFEAAHRRLRTSMAAGALYDLIFAVINLAAPQVGSSFLEIPLPEQQIYMRLSGVFLFVLALVYMLPVIHPGEYLGNVVVAIVARGAGAAFFIPAAIWFGQPPAFLALGMMDLLFAALHLVLLWKAAEGDLLRHYIG